MTPSELWRLWRGKEAMEKELAAGYDWKKSLEAAGKDLAHTLSGVMLTALIGWVLTPGSLEAVYQHLDLPATVGIIAMPFASAGFAALRNWLKHRDSNASLQG